jgi:hypothetical protein
MTHSVERVEYILHTYTCDVCGEIAQDKKDHDNLPPFWNLIRLAGSPRHICDTCSLRAWNLVYKQVNGVAPYDNN